MKSKSTAALLALCLGGIGIHKLYLGQIGRFALYLIFSWTFIPAAISVLECLSYLCYSDEKWNLEYNQQYAKLEQRFEVEKETLDQIKALKEEIKSLKASA